MGKRVCFRVCSGGRSVFAVGEGEPPPAMASPCQSSLWAGSELGFVDLRWREGKVRSTGREVVVVWVAGLGGRSSWNDLLDGGGRSGL